MFIVRPVSFFDIPSLLPLMEQLGYKSTYDELIRRYDIFMKNEGYGIAVACLDERIIGCVARSRSFLLIIIRY